MEWRPEASHEDPSKAGIGQPGDCRDRSLRVCAVYVPASRFEVAPTAPSSAVASHVVAPFFAPKTAHPFRPVAGFKMIEFILSTKKVANKEIQSCG